MKRALLCSFIIISALSTIPFAQMRVVPLDDEQGHVALGLVLRHLANTGIFMHTTAHPDDENNGLLVMLNRGQVIAELKNVFNTQQMAGINTVVVTDAAGNPTTAIPTDPYGFPGASGYEQRKFQLGFKVRF